MKPCFRVIQNYITVKHFKKKMRLKFMRRPFQIANEVKAIKADLKKKKSLLQMDELKCRKRVLRRLGYCTASDVIELKGRVACEISRYVHFIL